MRKASLWRVLPLLAATSLSTPATAQSSAPAPVASPAQADTRPDVIVILFDDVGFSDFGAFGSEIRTPTIDALAQAGLRFNHFDTRAICGASRAALLTGRNNQSVGMEDLPSHAKALYPHDNSKFQGGLVLRAQTVAEALKAGGYNTYALGKWHLTPGFVGGPGDDGALKETWPRQRGFDHYYGYMGGWTDQWHPKLVDEDTPIAAPETKGYNLTVDLVDHAIADLKAGKASGKPSFLYLALGTAHAPIQAPKSYIDRVGNRYAGGWDRLRETRFARQKQVGIIPADAVLTERSSADPAWSSLSPDQQRLYAHSMAVYAAFIEQTDSELARLIAYLKQSGRYDNTLIILASDNGAAAEGDADGGFWTPYHDKASLAERLAHLDEMGSPGTQPIYQRPWAWAGNTPFRRYKVWPYAGGTRDPLVISWPRGIQDAGGIRSQPVDIIDLAPTILDVAGAQFADTVNGEKQIPVAGASVRASFASADAKAGRPVQFFELRGSRAIRSGQWKAVAVHDKGKPFEQEHWELFDTSRDFSESTDVSAQYPDKVAGLQALWWQEASKYADPPLAYGPPGGGHPQGIDRP
ncbi:arylsulfatase [Sphingomonas sp. R-74633]|uniref:arylsulfatase n=1 Tax=Sphingomonas sp. R-74633 TaxID=2751188 RepID=UPI0015D2557D|nr:arylsulfatase [Sphingomonas sp. R-74633]NYT40683.1 arylsulfatase [Sphingomonas sp. R-74633]